MKDAQKKRLRRVVRRIRIEAKNAFRYYSATLIAFSLAMALLAAIFVLRLMGYQFTARMNTVLLIALISLLLVSMLGGVWGMILLSLTRKDEHVKEYFSQNARAETPDCVSDPPSALRVESAGIGADAVFLIAALVLWLGGSWLLVLLLTGESPLANNHASLPLFVIWFPAIRVTRLIRGGYERILLWYRPRPLRRSDRKREGVDEQAQ